MPRVATVLCTGHNLREHLAKYGIVGNVCAINDAIAHYPHKLSFACSLHKPLLENLLALRSLRNYPMPHTSIGPGSFSDNFSAYYSLDYALTYLSRTGYTTIRVLGAAFDNKGHYYDIIPTGPNYNIIPRCWNEQNYCLPEGTIICK